MNSSSLHALHRGIADNTVPAEQLTLNYVRKIKILSNMLASKVVQELIQTGVHCLV